MAGRKRFRDDQRLEGRDLVEDQKRMKAESKSSGRQRLSSVLAKQNRIALFL